MRRAPKIRRALAELESRPLNYDPAELDLVHPPRGWRLDDRFQPLPDEPPGPPLTEGSWEIASRLIRGYELADPSVVRAFYDEPEPRPGRNMLLELRALNLVRIYVGVRVNEVYDVTRTIEGREVRVFGWSYRTLEGHVERGQMDWEVWKWLDTGQVCFHVHAVSRPALLANPAIRIGFWLLRDHERGLFLDSTDRRMRTLTALALDPEGRGERIRAASEELTARPIRRRPIRDEPFPCLRRTCDMSLLRTAGMYLRRTPKLSEPTDLYEHRVKLLDGGELDLASWRGRPTLFVNTASKCGYTPQYEGLQKLYERYGDRGLQVLGTPSGDFADQEFDDAEEIGAFCQKNYGVSFTLTERASVRADPSPLWSDLARQPDSGPPAWNFTKYLVSADGKLIARWPTKVVPEDPEIVAAIEAALPAAEG